MYGQDTVASENVFACRLQNQRIGCFIMVSINFTRVRKNVNLPLNRPRASTQTTDVVVSAQLSGKRNTTKKRTSALLDYIKKPAQQEASILIAHFHSWISDNVRVNSISHFRSVARIIISGIFSDTTWLCSAVSETMDMELRMG